MNKCISETLFREILHPSDNNEAQILLYSSNFKCLLPSSDDSISPSLILEDTCLCNPLNHLLNSTCSSCENPAKPLSWRNLRRPICSLGQNFCLSFHSDASGVLRIQVTLERLEVLFQIQGLFLENPWRICISFHQNVFANASLRRRTLSLSFLRCLWLCF